MKKFSMVLFFVLFSLLMWDKLFSDTELTSGEMLQIKTISGSVFRGELFSITENKIEIVNSDGTIISLSREKIKSIEKIQSKKERNIYFQDSAANRFVIMPTGFGMDKGEFHVASHEIVLINASYGFSKNLSLWSGITFLGGVFNIRASLSPLEKIGFSSGCFMGMTWVEPVNFLVIPYGITSFGYENKNITLGFGLPVASFKERVVIPPQSTNDYEKIIEKPRKTRIAGGVLVLAGKIPVTSTTAVVSENWFVLNYDGKSWDTELSILPMAVFRIAGYRWSWDIGTVLPVTISDGKIRWLLGGNTFIPLPILSITYRID